ncbi:MAG: hypothetical protein FD125_1247 [bacterium]|nr:MAG: hypothetical protein FD125_1247 [bacterium]
MGEAFGLDLTALTALQGVVADGRGRLHASFEITGLERYFAIRDRGRVAGPDAGVAVGLQFQCDGIAVGLGLTRGALLGGANLFRKPGQRLDVVTVFMGDDIGAGKVRAGRAEVGFELRPEGEVQINVAPQPVGVPCSYRVTVGG